MWQLFRNKNIHQHDGIEIKKSAVHGRGVFSCQTFKPGAIIEIAPVIILDKTERDFLQQTTLFGYYFVLADEQNSVALGLGYASLYNHAYSANAVYSISIKKKLITVKSCKNILVGEEITLNYNGHSDDISPVYFPPEETFA
jgi:uncharacterized protein